MLWVTPGLQKGCFIFYEYTYSLKHCVQRSGSSQILYLHRAVQRYKKADTHPDVLCARWRSEWAFVKYLAVDFLFLKRNLVIRNLFDICALLGYHTAHSGKSVPTFQDKLSVPSSRFKPRPLKMEPIVYPETSVRNCHCILRNIAEERRSNLHHGRSLKSRIELDFLLTHLTSSPLGFPHRTPTSATNRVG